jgi:hypothetical protein
MGSNPEKVMYGGGLYPYSTWGRLAAFVRVALLLDKT